MTPITIATISRSPSIASISSSLFDFIDDDNSVSSSSSSSASIKDVEVSFDMAKLDDDDLVSLHSKSSVEEWLALVASPIPKKTRPPMTSPPVSMINMSIVVNDNEDESSSEQSLDDDDFGFGLTSSDDDFYNTEAHCAPGNGGATVVSLSDSESASSSDSVVVEPATPLLLDIADVVTTQIQVAPVTAPAVKVQEQQIIRDWSILRVIDLKAELKCRRLKCSGRKAVLVARLTEDDQVRAALAAVANEDDDVACETFSDTELMTLMTGELLEDPVEQKMVSPKTLKVDSVPAEGMSGSASTEGELAIARVLHYLRFYHSNKKLLSRVHAVVYESFEKGIATNSLDDVPGVVFESFVNIMGQDFLPIFQASLQFSEAEVRSVEWN